VSTLKFITLVVLVVFAAAVAQPAPAEALEPTIAISLGALAIGLVTIIAVVVIANVRDSQSRAAGEPDAATVVALDSVPVQAL
jgi:hypothetical protein